MTSLSFECPTILKLILEYYRYSRSIAAVTHLPSRHNSLSRKAGISDLPEMGIPKPFMRSARLLPIYRRRRGGACSVGRGPVGGGELTRLLLSAARLCRDCS